MLLGLFFHREDWLGGYASFKHRLYRLGHISFFGLGVVNLCFFLTVHALGGAGPRFEMASWAFIAGAVSMPICCLVIAHFPRALPLSTVPVLSLLLGGFLRVLGIMR
ncbi:MAG TPA: hypothetical protein VN578_11905 [Candidatus Binatia bacterium]|nr:hypothetical protein [Candidatus Binatia bacterium]